ncbi:MULTISPECIES: outer membrane protein assembly factor BamB family protein [Halolamina]|uniref:Outer membrane protein assembly factor BamB, contains PQQ-like beta-propeller repeat n=1 Tax=Halolamina pelagica TaxID=699431 RepID=A0A1I5MJB5_9EURY|nr:MULTISPECIES: PQQ-binding-like beta-propeller repeat protein [Halolamina]SFP09672.1 Outer membrane protein assembly factor BamB, contains PQQ-like beta-propeller repeat [Halolamina pelagica]
MPSTTRRDLLAALGVGAALSGCLSVGSASNDLGTVDGKWPMDGRDAGHARRVDAGPSEPTRVWRTEFDDVRGVRTPSLADGDLYVPADAVSGTARSRYRLYALSAGDGELRWQVPLRVQPNGAPAVSPDRIVVGAKRSTERGRVVCFNPRYGEEEWLNDVAARLTAPPTVAEGVVYVGDWRGRVHALGALAGDVRWTRRIDAGDGGRTFPNAVAVHDGTLYLGSASGNTGVVALDADTGEEHWRVSTGAVTEGPVVTEDLVVVRSHGMVTALDTDGQHRWTVNVLEPDPRAVAVGDERVFVPAGDRLYAIDRDGEEAWRHEVDDGRVGTPTVAGDAVVFRDGDRGLTARAVTDGRERWTVSTDGGGQPIVTDGALFQSSSSGVIARGEN